MIFYYIILFVSTLLTEVFSWLPVVHTLPPILGVDIDTQLSQGMGMFYAFATAIWPLLDVFYGFLALMFYYSVKMVLRIFLGARAPQ